MRDVSPNPAATVRPLSSEIATDAEVAQPRNGACDRRGGVPAAPGSAAARASTANAVTAVLLHCDTIRRRAAEPESDLQEILASLEHIATNARRLWAAFEALPSDMPEGV